MFEIYIIYIIYIYTYYYIILCGSITYIITKCIRVLLHLFLLYTAYGEYKQHVLCIVIPISTRVLVPFYVGTNGVRGVEVDIVFILLSASP